MSIERRRGFTGVADAFNIPIDLRDLKRVMTCKSGLLYIPDTGLGQAVTGNCFYHFDPKVFRMLICITIPPYFLHAATISCRSKAES
jgi:hypothetical protein